MSIYKKIHQIMCETEGIAKNLSVGEGKNSYKAVGEASVLNSIKPLLKAHGVILIPIEVNIKEDFQEFQGKYGTSQRYLSTLHAKYKIVDIDTGEFEILETVGYGTDSQDKGSGKAMTYAYKALIQKTFMLFSGEDTDNEHSDDITAKNTIKKSSEKSDQEMNNKLVEDTGKVRIDKIKVSALEKLIEETGASKTDIEKFAKCNIEEFNVSQWAQIVKTLEKRKVNA